MMDAAEFTKEAKRMCNTQERSCRGCGAYRGSNDCLLDFFDDDFDPTEAVRIVEEWSKAHPKQTNIEKFKEVFGRLPRSYVMADGKPMSGMPDEWWNMPYEAPKGELDA